MYRLLLDHRRTYPSKVIRPDSILMLNAYLELFDMFKLIFKPLLIEHELYIIFDDIHTNTESLSGLCDNP